MEQGQNGTKSHIIFVSQQIRFEMFGLGFGSSNKNKLKVVSFFDSCFHFHPFFCKILSFSLLVAVAGSRANKICSTAEWHLYWKTQSSITCPIHSSPSPHPLSTCQHTLIKSFFHVFWLRAKEDRAHIEHLSFDHLIFQFYLDITLRKMSL